MKTLSLASVVLLWPASGFAQTAKPPRLEITAATGWPTPVAVGTANAIEKAPDGGAFTLFNSSGTERGPAGFEAGLAFRLTSRLIAEATGSLGSRELRTSISGDFEGAEPVTLTLPLKRYTIEGAAVWLLHRGRFEPYARGGAGWMRQITDDKVLVDDSVIVVAGGGIRYWLRDRDHGAFRRLGLRFDARAIDRVSELIFGSRRISGAIGGGVIFGF